MKQINLFASMLIILFATATHVKAQQLVQTVRGSIVDDVLKTPLPGVTVAILGTDPILGAATDMDGNFRITNVPVGNHRIRISFIGYKEVVLSNVLVGSGKETVLQVSMVEDVTSLKEVVVRADQEKNKPLNDMATVSARTFSVEETRRYAAAVNDPARMVSSFAGVAQTEDGGNSISIRGNTPFGLLWKMEGIDIPNPNHFATIGGSGGGISILSAQTMGNSDFMTGAFPAEYGNALSGVFDIRLRKGNNENYEHTIQAGLLGIDVATEGPFTRDYKGSYLINYRYSTLSLLGNLGVSIGDGTTDFQDLSWNINLPAGKAGTFSFFGFGGLSSQSDEANRDSLEWTEEDARYDSKYHSNTGAAGMKHLINIGENLFIQSAVLFSGKENGYHQERLDDDYVPVRDYEENYLEKRITVSSVANIKLSSRSYLRSGFYFNTIGYDLYKRAEDDDTEEMVTFLNSKGTGELIQAFSQWNYRAGEKVTVNAGLHYLHFLLNNTNSLEPRASITWQADGIQSFSLGYGLHGQMQPIGAYFGSPTGEGRPNKNIGFTKAHHLVLAYDRSISSTLRIKTETYYQHLFNVPVSANQDDPLSILNVEYGYVTDSLVNKGRGRNYGVEFTLEQFMHKGRYFLFSASLYDSKYKALDNIWRNTRYNGNYVFSFTGGKDFDFMRNGKRKTLGVNLRTVYAGGLRTTPIDVQRSIENEETEYIDSESFTLQQPAYFRTDLRISYRVNRARTTSILALDIQNVTNRQNVYGTYFEPLTGEFKTSYMTPLIPVLSYRIEF